MPRARTLAFAGAGVLLLLVAAFLDLLQGQGDAPWWLMRDAVLGRTDRLDLEWQFKAEIVRDLRLQRAAAGALAGGTLAAAAVLLQSVTRNPLAEPATLGLSAGGVLAVTATTAFASIAPGAPTIAVAFVGVLGATALIGALAVLGGAGPVRLVLAGMAIGLALAAITGGIRLIRETETTGLFLWGAGNLTQSEWGPVRTGLIVAVVALAVALALGRSLDVAALGDETAKALGLRGAPVRVLAVLAAAVLAAVSVGVAGAFAFVGILAAGLARLARPRGHLGMILVAAPWGGAIILIADVASRALLGTSNQVPAGLLCALLGAPVLVMVARRLKDTGPPALDRASARARVRPGVVPVMVLVVLPIGILVGLAVGEPMLSPARLVDGLLHPDSDPGETLGIRAPRLAVAVVAGAALAASGVILQTAVRNPFAGPELVGVTGGASVGAFTVLLLVPDAARWTLPLAAFVGSVVALVIVLAAAGRRGSSPQRLALIGLAVTAAASAITTLMVIRAEPAASQAIVWLAGSTYGAEWADLWIVLPPVAVLTVVGLAAVRHLDVLALDDDAARGLGLPVGAARVGALALGTAIAASAVAVVGAVAFLGLLGPHMARLVAGAGHRRLIPVAMVFGALLMGLGDVLGRAAFPPTELPAGIVVAAIGAPYLAFMLWRSRAVA
ncbi:MAG: iron ABC transporter permease [Solirubrobacteraceae bacterium]|nr:iron ABC transporter permease [Solirubrobacteraceae bacterium]